MDFRSEFFNDFEKVVFERNPQLEIIKSLLYDQGALFAALSGSGSTVYGLFPTGNAVKKAQRILGENYRCQMAQPVSTE